MEGWIKWVATGKPGRVSLIERRCSVIVTANLRLVPPTYRILQRLQIKIYTTLVEMQEKWSVTMKEGPWIDKSWSLETTGQVLHRLWLQGNVQGWEWMAVGMTGPEQIVTSDTISLKGNCRWLCKDGLSGRVRLETLNFLQMKRFIGYPEGWKGSTRVMLSEYN